jgi:diadenosine tetraphosphate (Ap4A) HIT family hydrolase
MSKSSAPATVVSEEMIDMKDVMQTLRTKAPAESGETPRERKPYVNKKSPTYVQDYYQFGEKVRDHIKYMKTIDDNEDKTDRDRQSVVALSYTINRVMRFLGMKQLQNVHFVVFPYRDLYDEFFEKPDYREEITSEIIDAWSSMDVQFKILFNTLISIFTYRRNLQTDVRIGKKVDDFFFLNACIQFSFQIHEDKFPTNLEFYQVMSALAVLSNEKKNFSIENVNTQLSKEDSEIQFKSDNPHLRFFKDRCYGSRD